MLDRSELALAVGHADVAMQMGFSGAAAHFHFADSEWWKDVRFLKEVSEPLTLKERCLVVVEGDVRAHVTVSGNGAVIVYGSVQASIETKGMCEIIIAGNLHPDGWISEQGSLHLFIGGDSLGEIRSNGSLHAWIEGHLRGRVWTGHPVARLKVRRDCSADIRPSSSPALLYLEVDGSMPFPLLEATASAKYTQFNASIAKSDPPAGIYPKKETFDSLRQQHSFNRWVIRTSG